MRDISKARLENHLCFTWQKRELESIRKEIEDYQKTGSFSHYRDALIMLREFEKELSSSLSSCRRHIESLLSEAHDEHEKK